MAPASALLERSWRSRPLVFSFGPRCQGLRGSQKSTCLPDTTVWWCSGRLAAVIPGQRTTQRLWQPQHRGGQRRRFRSAVNPSGSPNSTRWWLWCSTWPPLRPAAAARPPAWPAAPDSRTWPCHGPVWQQGHPARHTGAAVPNNHAQSLGRITAGGRIRTWAWSSGG